MYMSEESNKKDEPHRKQVLQLMGGYAKYEGLRLPLSASTYDPRYGRYKHE
jgi:hypothetical protein